MKNEIAHIKIDVTDIKCLLKEHIRWEADKYEHLDDRYATKKELEELKIETNWNRNKIVDISIKLANVLVLLGLGAKVSGLI